MNPKPYHNPSIGCYFDGQTYNDDLRVLDLALSYGWQDEEAQKMVDAGEDDLSEEQLDVLSETVDDAIDYLNDQETRSFLSWQWNDGYFGLYPDVESAKESVDFVSSREYEYPHRDYRGEWLHVNDHGNCTLYLREDGDDYVSGFDDVTNEMLDSALREIIRDPSGLLEIPGVYELVAEYYNNEVLELIGVRPIDKEIWSVV